MNTRNFLSTLFLCLFAYGIYAQTGSIRGKITDAKTGEAIMFANVLAKELSSGTTSDLDGNYSLSLNEGTYTIEFSYVGYANLSVTEVLVSNGKDTELHVKLSGDSEVLQVVMVSAKVIRNTETALLAIQRRAPGLLDGISTQSIKRSGDSDVGSAIKRVTGVSVEGGKHVIIRGLGDRYSKTILNGMSVPGLDPDRNSVQLDIFPTNLVDNIIVYKSFIPDLPGDFSGAAWLISSLRIFQVLKTFSISAGGSL